MLRQQAYSRDEIWPQAEVGFRFVLEVAPDSFDERRDGYQGFQVRADGGTALNWRRSDDRLQTRLLAGEIRDIACLTQRLLRLYAYLDIDHRYDADALCLLAVVLRTRWQV